MNPFGHIVYGAYRPDSVFPAAIQGSLAEEEASSNQIPGESDQSRQDN
jgi:hypothetical protein